MKIHHNISYTNTKYWHQLSISLVHHRVCTWNRKKEQNKNGKGKRTKDVTRKRKHAHKKAPNRKRWKNETMNLFQFRLFGHMFAQLSMHVHLNKGSIRISRLKTSWCNQLSSSYRQLNDLCSFPIWCLWCFFCCIRQINIEGFHPTPALEILICYITQGQPPFVIVIRLALRDLFGCCLACLTIVEFIEVCTWLVIGVDDRLHLIHRSSSSRNRISRHATLDSAAKVVFWVLRLLQAKQGMQATQNNLCFVVAQAEGFSQTYRRMQEEASKSLFVSVGSAWIARGTLVVNRIPLESHMMFCMISMALLMVSVRFYGMSHACLQGLNGISNGFCWVSMVAPLASLQRKRRQSSSRWNPSCRARQNSKSTCWKSRQNSKLRIYNWIRRRGFGVK